MARHFGERIEPSEIMKALLPAPDEEVHEDSYYDTIKDLAAGSPSRLWSQPLYPSQQADAFLDTNFSYVTLYFTECLCSAGDTWSFWDRWFGGFLDGEPLNWTLQSEVALISDHVWQAGPEAVAGAIARIEAEFELRARIEAVEADQVLVQQQRLGIGGNNPPEEIDDPVVAENAVILWDSIAGLKEEVDADEPDAARVAYLIDRLGAALKAIMLWCGRKADLVVDTTIKSAIPAGGTGYFYFNPAKAEAVLKAAQAWLPFLAR